MNICINILQAYNIFISHKLKCAIKLTTHQNSAQTVNFCNSDGEVKYKPCPLLLKQNVFAILEKCIRCYINAENFYVAFSVKLL